MTQSTAISRHAYEGADVMRAYGRGLPRVIHVSLGTNDDPRSLDAFRAAIRAVMAVAGPRRCVVWANIVRPPVAGASYAGYNRVLAAESHPRRNLRVVAELGATDRCGSSYTATQPRAGRAGPRFENLRSLDCTRWCGDIDGWRPGAVPSGTGGAAAALAREGGCRRSLRALS